MLAVLGHSKPITCFSSPLSPKIDAGGRGFWRVMVVKITSLAENGRQNYKFDSSKNQSGIRTFVLWWYRWNHMRGDEKQLIDLEWPYKTHSQSRDEGRGL